MARRKKSLFAALLPTPKRRSRRRPAPLFPAPTRTRTATTPRTTTLAKKPAAASRPGGLGTWTEARYVGLGGTRGYFVYVPPGLRRTTAVPLMVLLHGCAQSPVEFAAATRFNQLADRQGFVVVYPHQTITYNMQRCWNWFEPRHQLRLAGEPLILAGLTERIIADRTRWHIDPTRVYVAGISAGGAMATTLGANFPDLFAAVGVHSGPPFRSANGGSTALAAMHGRTPMPDVAEIPAREVGLPPTIVFQGTADYTVRAVNAERITGQWLEVQESAAVADPRNRIARTRTSTSAVGRRTSTITRWYSVRGRTRLESWLVGGLGHAWSGGLSRGSFSDPLGPRATTQMWKFLSAQRLGE